MRHIAGKLESRVRCALVQALAMIPDVESFEETAREVLAALLVGAVIAAAALGTCRKRKRAQRISTPVDPVEIRRKRLATLQSSQV